MFLSKAAIAYSDKRKHSCFLNQSLFSILAATKFESDRRRMKVHKSGSACNNRGQQERELARGIMLMNCFWMVDAYLQNKSSQ